MEIKILKSGIIATVYGGGSYNQGQYSQSATVTNSSSGQTNKSSGKNGASSSNATDTQLAGQTSNPANGSNPGVNTVNVTSVADTPAHPAAKSYMNLYLGAGALVLVIIFLLLMRRMKHPKAPPNI